MKVGSGRDCVSRMDAVAWQYVGMFVESDRTAHTRKQLVALSERAAFGLIMLTLSGCNGKNHKLSENVLRMRSDQKTTQTSTPGCNMRTLPDGIHESVCVQYKTKRSLHRGRVGCECRLRNGCYVAC